MPRKIVFMKKIFLTGASSGIGRATAELLCAQGHEVWGTSREPARLPALARLHPVRLDLTEPASIADAWERARAEAGGFEVVINNAGAGHFDPAATLSAETLARQFQLLLFGQIEISQQALRAWRTQPRGLLINVTSLAARLPMPFSAAYNAAKAAMSAYTTTLQLELAGSSVRVVDLQPGDISTDFNDHLTRAPALDAQDAAAMQRAWEVIQRTMQKAPPPELVAREIARLLERAHPPARVTVGDPFQRTFAPAIFALLPPTWRIWALRRHYKL